MDYAAVIERIVDAEQAVIGKVAVRIAREQEQLSVSDDGDVSAADDLDADDVEDVLDAYQDVIGDAAVGNARRALAEHTDELEGLALPDTIDPRSEQ